jgi:hypothetical protein
MSTATMLSRTAQIASSGFTRCTVQIRCTRAARDVATSATASQASSTSTSRSTSVERPPYMSCRRPSTA